MNLLFLTLADITSIENHGIYEDLLREFARHGHQVYVVSPSERNKGEPTRLIKEKHATILKVRTGNVQKTNLIEKGISTLTLEPLMLRAIKRHFSDIHFDLVLYSTPPITLARVVAYLKRRDGAKTYLLLKDIFPQNAVDLGMMQQGGLLHRYFRAKEKRLYALSDRIGCMSPANVAYVLKHNPQIAPERVEVCPNSIEPRDLRLSAEEKAAMRAKYGLPQDKRIFIYGGNLGKPQDVPFIIQCLQACKDIQEAFFLIVGSGTDYPKLQAYVDKEKPQHVRLLPFLPREEYDRMIAACDVGMIFLDHRFTIPNFPSRLLSYMQAGLPVLACTDKNTDIGKVIVDGGFGWWCGSESVFDFSRHIRKILNETYYTYGVHSLDRLVSTYTTVTTYQRILDSISESRDKGEI